MMRNAWTFPLALFLLLSIAAVALVDGPGPGDVPVTRGVVSAPGSDGDVDPAVVDQFVTETLRRSAIPGASLAIARDDRILYTASYGDTGDGRPVTPDTPMPIASLSKSLTAAAVMRLVEDGRVALDERARRYLPEFELADPRAGEITVRQLLNHSSGLRADGLPNAPAPMHRTIAERVAWMGAATLVAGPGAHTSYDNANYTVLARLIERVTGESFPSALRNLVFAPLGMSTSRTLITTRDTMPDVADGHMLMYGVPVAWRMPADLVAGAGGVVTSANDLGRWLVFNSSGGRTMTGEQLLQPERVHVMHVPSGPGGEHGFGWRRRTLPDGTGGRASAVVDHLLAGLTILMATSGIVGVARSGEWVRRRADRPLWRLLIRCAPYIIIVAIVLGAPWLRSVFNRGHKVPWSLWFQTWPPALIAVAATGLSCGAIVLSRGFRLARTRL